MKAKAITELRRLMAERDSGAPNLEDTKRITYSDLRAGLLANYVERGNRSLMMRADGESTVMGLPQLDKFFGFDTDNPGPSVSAIGTDTAREFVEQR